jgi:alpha-tubulin suppressor-like RCC1 family protein
MSTFGQLGRGAGVAEARSVSTPGIVVHEGVKGAPLVALQVSCGGMHTAAVGTKGELYAWGRADSGQLGIGKKWMQVQQVSEFSRGERNR